jgi:hypothetical protein
MDARDALDELIEVSAWWAMPSVDWTSYRALTIHGADEAVVDAAAQALAAGFDSPALRELAGMPPRTNWWEFRAVLERTMEELGVAFDLQPESAQILALRFVCRRYLAGDITMREAATWAYTYVGYESADIAQDLVRLEDDLDAGAWLPLFATASRRRRLVREHRESLTRRFQVFLDATADVGRRSQ